MSFNKRSKFDSAATREELEKRLGALYLTIDIVSNLLSILRFFPYVCCEYLILDPNLTYMLQTLYSYLKESKILWYCEFDVDD